LVGEISVSDQSPNWKNTYLEILSNSPELKVAQEILAEKQALLQRQLAGAIPNIETQIGAGYDSGTNSGMLNLQIGAPIPLRNKNCGNIAAARGEIQMAMENVRRIEQSIKSRLAIAAQEYDAASATVEKYTNEIIPQTEESLQLSEEGYLAGELEFLQTLVIRRSFYDATMKLAQAQGRLAQSAAKINGLLLSGGLDAHTDYTSDDGLRGQSLGGQ
jgi:cobalt-zinc-cadmium efflux system outer membrane protein